MGPAGSIYDSYDNGPSFALGFWAAGPAAGIVAAASNVAQA